MRKVVVEKVEQYQEHKGIFVAPNTKEGFYYERSENNDKLIKVCCCIGSDRDTNDENYAEITLSQDELQFIEEQLNVKEVESSLVLEVLEILEYNKKHSPIYESITFKCYQMNSVITAHLFANKVKPTFSVRYFSTFDNEDRSLKLEVKTEVAEKLMKEVLEKANANEKIMI